MKKILLVFISILFFNLGQAQMGFTPDPAEIGGTTEIDDVELDLIITNNTSNNYSLLWTLRKVEMPEEWSTQVCDLNTCYDLNIDACPTDRPNPLAAGASAPFIFHTWPFETKGVGTFQLNIFDESDPANILLSIPMTTEILTTSTLELDIQELKIFPNPTSDYFQLSNSKDVDKISIYNIVGKEMKTYKVEHGSSYDVTYLPVGMYLVRLYDSKNSVKKVLRLSKR